MHTPGSEKVTTQLKLADIKEPSWPEILAALERRLPGLGQDALRRGLLEIARETTFTMTTADTTAQSVDVLRAITEALAHFRWSERSSP